MIYDPYGYASNFNPALYYRVLEGGAERCIQYYYYWDRQECTRSYLINEPNTTASITGLLFLILELIVANIIALEFPLVFVVPWWVHALLMFMLGSYIGFRWNNDVGDLLEGVVGQIVGRFFTHDYDFEPILVFLEREEVKRVVISGRGDVDTVPHRNDIFILQDSYSEGDCKFLTSDASVYPPGREESQTPFKEFPLNRLAFVGSRPCFAVITCYHAFTAFPQYYGENVFTNEMKMPLLPMTGDVLGEWYEKKHFGHDVADPFSFPSAKFAAPTGVAQYGRREYMLGLLDGIGMITEGLIKLKNALFILTRRK